MVGVPGVFPALVVVGVEGDIKRQRHNPFQRPGQVPPYEISLLLIIRRSRRHRERRPPAKMKDMTCVGIDKNELLLSRQK